MSKKYLDRLDAMACLFLVVQTAPREEEYKDIVRVLESVEHEHPTPGMQRLIGKIKRKQLKPSQVVDEVRAMARAGAKVKDD